MARDWQEVDGALYKKFVFANFVEAFGFMTRVAAIAEAQNHHPDWSNSWNTVVRTIKAAKSPSVTIGSLLQLTNRSSRNGKERFHSNG